MAADTAIETPVVTGDDLKAFKSAQYVVLFYRPDGSEGPKWGMRIGHQVRLDDLLAEQKLARIVKSGLWTRTWADDHSVDFVRVIAASEKHCQIERYSNDSVDRSEVTEAVWLDTGFSRPRSHVITALNFVRPGDELGIHFVGSNNTESIKAVHHVRDECYLRVIHGEKLFVFMMGFYVGPNNTARIVR